MSVRQSKTHEDDPSIARALEQLYEVISFEEGEDPNWQGLRAIFSPHARITRITPEGTDYMDRDGFLAMTRSLLELGAYTSFYEFEVARNVERFGGAAQVWSLYETRRNRDARAPLGRGVNSIQLIRDGDGWRVLGLLWDETAASSNLDVDTIARKGGE
jgi:Domain of unknown function (DUF4440)